MSNKIYIGTEEIGGSGGSADLTNYYNKSHIDSSYGVIDASLKAFDSSIKELSQNSGGPFENIVNPNNSTKISYKPVNDQNVSTNVGTNSLILASSRYAAQPVVCNGDNCLVGGRENTIQGNFNIAWGDGITLSSGDCNVVFGKSNGIKGGYGKNFVCGETNAIFNNEGNIYVIGAENTIGNSMSYKNLSYVSLIGHFNNTTQTHTHALGNYNIVRAEYGIIIGNKNKVTNKYECATGHVNNSSYGTSNFGDASNYLFTVGNGKESSYRRDDKDANNTPHNAFEVRQSGDIYVADVSATGAYYEKPMINLQHKLYGLDASALAFDASIKELASRPSGGGGSADLTNYYNKSHIDSSYGVIDASLKYLDASALAFDASIKELAARPSGGGGSNISKLSDLTNDCDFRPITYITKDDYDDLVEAETLDDDTMYVITDLADSDDLATLVSIQDLSTAKAQINASLSSTANTIITEANTSINYWKTTACQYTNTSTNYWKTQAINAVQSQQSVSVNAVDRAKNSAISDINSAADAKIATMKDMVVLSADDYAQIARPDENTIYFITA